MPIHKGNLSALKFFTAQNAGSYDRLVYTATFGQDYEWKKQIVRSVKGSKMILDLGCGTGILSTALRKVNYLAEVVGLDLNFEYLQVAWAKRIDIPLLNATVEELPFVDEVFDSVVTSYVPKYIHVERMIEECLRVLKNNGTLVIHDFTYPNNKLMQMTWKSYFVLLKIISNIVRSWKDVFMELDNVIEESRWLKDCMSVLESKGMKSVKCTHHTLGTAAIIVAHKK
jgi:demethylmenaquinone methyltransferase / 2-methoxy-6-polyprenyl-1,4-benzoquinol methylase